MASTKQDKPWQLVKLIQEGTLSELEDFLSKTFRTRQTASHSKLINDTILQGMTPLGHSVYRRNVNIVNLLLKFGADATSNKNWDLLHTAVEFNDLDIVECLAKAGMGVNTVDPYSMYHTPLTRAVRNYNLDAIRVLLDNGADVNMKGYRRSAPIHMACTLGWAAGLRLLIDRDANPCSTYDFNCKSVFPLGKLPRLDEEGEEAWQCMNILLEAMYKKNLTQKQWLNCLQTSLIPAIRINNYKLIKHLLSTDELQAEGTRFLGETIRIEILNSLLVDTAGFCSMAIAKFLLEAGASANAGYTQTASSQLSVVLGQSAAFQAVGSGCPRGVEVLKLLIEHGARLTSDTELQQPAQWSVILTEAIRLRFEKTAVALLLGNCKPLVPSQSIYSALYPAQRALLNFLEIYILAGGEKRSVDKWLSSHTQLRNVYPGHTPRLTDDQVGNVRAAMSTSQNLTHLCRVAIRGVLRRYHRPVAASVTQLPVPPLIQNFLLLRSEEEQLTWNQQTPSMHFL